MSYVNQGLGSTTNSSPVVKHLLRRYSRHAPSSVVAAVVQRMTDEALVGQAPAAPAVVADVVVDASAVASQRGGLFGQPKGIFGPMLGAVPGGRGRRRKKLARPVASIRAFPALKPGEYKPVSLVRSYFPWISPGELVDDGAASFSLAAKGVNWVRLNFYDRGGILVDQQDFYPVGPEGISGLLVPHLMASMGPTLLREALPAADIVEVQLDAMDTGVPTAPGTAGMGSYSRSGLGAMMVSSQGDPVKTPLPVQDSKGTITSAAPSSLTSASTRTLQTQLRKVGAGCIAVDGKWGPNTAGAYARWAASSSQNGRVQRSASATAAPSVGAGTVYIDDTAKRTLAAESTGRSDQCGTVTSTSTSTTTSTTDVTSPDLTFMVDATGEGVPGWVWGVSAALLGVGVIGAVAVAKSGGKSPAAATTAKPRTTARKTTRRKPAAKTTTRRKPARKTSARKTSKRKTSKRKAFR